VTGRTAMPSPHFTGGVRVGHPRHMPIVHIHVRRGRPAAEREAILDGVHAALVEAFKIPDLDRNQVLHEHDAEHLESSRGPAFTMVELTVFAGRSDAAKRALYAAIVGNLAAAPGIPPEQVLIALHEPPQTNWGVRGGQMASDVALGFKVDV
jgi:phenylpyruvate tautomerase PptA (4-oxalocrotonate tautomerase family)